VWVNAVIAVAYLVTIAAESEGGALAALRSPEVLTSVYGNLILFFMLAVTAGTIRTRNLALIGQLQSRWNTLRESFEATVRTLAAAIEAADPFTEQHVERVSSYAEAIARRMKLPEDEVEIIRFGAILHDVGKIAVPSHLLRKSEPITDEEYLEIKKHVEAGAKLLERTGLLEEAIPLVRYHDERWDGRTSGRYAAVYGLAGEAIPLGARIITVADAFDAMTSDRPYRRSLGVEQAAAELHAQAGRQFDPEVVRVFLGMLREQGCERVPTSGPFLAVSPVGGESASLTVTSWS
jgi:putative nucleotidyltransferase with HDIG domain